MKINVDLTQAEFVDSSKPILTLSNVAIPEATLVGAIYWLKVDTPFTLTADTTLPDGNYMIMVQQVVEISRVNDDVRFIGSVASGVLTINGAFPKMGNYVVTAERMNKALDYIGAGVHLSFDTVEFDVHY